MSDIGLARLTKSTEATHVESLPAASYVHGFPSENKLDDLRFKLAYNLQSTLDLHNTIELFFNNIQEVVQCSGLEYHNKPLNVRLNLGMTAKHSATYNVSSENLLLGAITFSRNKRFLNTELAKIEMLIGALFYPLRNALMYKEALENSMRDALTGIGNRAAMDKNFEREIKLAKRQRSALALIVIDVDHFKGVNDKHGHHNGDKVLIHISNIIQKSLRETDQVFRYGGEEFVALLNSANMHSAYMTAERIRMNIAMTPLHLNGEDFSFTASMGVSSLSPNDDTILLFDRADKALYMAKKHGRNRVVSSENDEQYEIGHRERA